MAKTSDLLVLVESIAGNLKSSHDWEEMVELLEFLGGGLDLLWELSDLHLMGVVLGQRDLEASERTQEGRFEAAGGDLHGLEERWFENFKFYFEIYRF